MSDRVAQRARAHKQAFADYLAGLVRDAELPSPLARQLYLLAEGAMVAAGIFASTEPATQARDAARSLIHLHRESGLTAH